MKKIFTLCKLSFVLFLFIGIVFNTYGQDWTKKKSDLYYIGSKGKVYIEPDYSAMAVYFKKDILSKSIV